MIQTWLPVLAVFALFAYWIRSSRLFASLGFSSRNMLMIFAAKCAWCLLFAWVHARYANGGDTHDFFDTGGQVHRALFRDPRDYFGLVFLPCQSFITPGMVHYYHSVTTYGNESSYILTRLNAVFNLFSFGSYPAHLIMFSFVTLPGLLCLLRFFYDAVAVNKRWITLLVLAFPPIAFWCNGMHKEALALSGIGCLLYAVQLVRRNGVGLKPLLYLLFGALQLIVRPYLVLFLLPVFVALMYERVWSRRVIAVVVGVFMIIVAAVFSFMYFHGADTLIKKKHDFALRSHAAGQELSFDHPWHALIVALYRAFVMPLPTSLKWLPFFLFNAVVFVLPMVTFKQFDAKRFYQLGLWLMLAAVLYFVFIGFLVPDAGAMQRYKAPMLCLLLGGWLVSLRGNFMLSKM